MSGVFVLASFLINVEISVLDSIGDVGKYCSLGCLGNYIGGLGVVSYYDATNSDLKLCKFTFVVEEINTIDTLGDVGKFNALDLHDVFGLLMDLVISYYDASNGDLKGAWAHYPYDAFEIFRIDSVGDVGLYTSICMVEDTIPYISYYDATNGDLKLTYFSDSGWIIQRVDTLGDVGKYNSIAHYKDIIYISYYDSTNGNLKLARYSGGNWEIQKVDTLGDVGKYTSIWAGDTSSSFVSYYAAGNGDLRYAEIYLGNVSIYSGDTLGDVGLFSDFMKWTLGLIFYYDKTNGNLKRAGIEIDTFGDVGGYCSGFELINHDIVVYYDFTNGDLKKAIIVTGTEENRKNLNNTSFSIIPTFRNVFISYYLPYSSYVNLKVFSITGKLIDELIDTRQQSGEYNIIWEPQNLSNGIYFLQMRINNFVKSKKIILIK